MLFFVLKPTISDTSFFYTSAISQTITWPQQKLPSPGVDFTPGPISVTRPWYALEMSPGFSISEIGARDIGLRAQQRKCEGLGDKQDNGCMRNNYCEQQNGGNCNGRGLHPQLSDAPHPKLHYLHIPSTRVC